MRFGPACLRTRGPAFREGNCPREAEAQASAVARRVARRGTTPGRWTRRSTNRRPGSPGTSLPRPRWDRPSATLRSSGHPTNPDTIPTRCRACRTGPRRSASSHAPDASSLRRWHCTTRCLSTPPHRQPNTTSWWSRPGRRTPTRPPSAADTPRGPPAPRGSSPSLRQNADASSQLTISTGQVGSLLELARIAAHHPLVLRLRHLAQPQVKRLGDPDAMLGGLGRAVARCTSSAGSWLWLPPAAWRPPLPSIPCRTRPAG